MIQWTTLKTNQMSKVGFLQIRDLFSLQQIGYLQQKIVLFVTETCVSCIAVNANGNSIPPMFIFPRRRYQDHFIPLTVLRITSLRVAIHIWNVTQCTLQKNQQRSILMYSQCGSTIFRQGRRQNPFRVEHLRHPDFYDVIWTHMTLSDSC